MGAVEGLYGHGGVTAEEKGGQMKQVEVTCAFCGGKGTDPFGVMSPLSTCQVCRGAGVRTLPAPVAGCACCGSTGVYPRSRLTCTSCGGVGQVAIPEGAVACPVCGGSGQAKDDFWPDSPLPCGHCGGKGVVAPARA